MTVILLSCQDLFMKNIDLTGQLLFTDSTIPAFFPVNASILLISALPVFFQTVLIFILGTIYEHLGLLLI